MPVNIGRTPDFLISAIEERNKGNIGMYHHCMRIYHGRIADYLAWAEPHETGLSESDMRQCQIFHDQERYRHTAKLNIIDKQEREQRRNLK